MASAAGSIISGVLSATGGAGSEMAPAAGRMFEDKPKENKMEVPQINQAEIKEAVAPAGPSAPTEAVPSQSSESPWQKVAQDSEALKQSRQGKQE